MAIGYMIQDEREKYAGLYMGMLDVFFFVKEKGN